MEPIAWRHPEVINIRGQINILQLSRSALRNVRRYAPTLARDVKLLRTSVRERLYHQLSVTRHVTRGNRGVVPHNAAHQRCAAHVSREPIYPYRARCMRLLGDCDERESLVIG
jgi:hypothetical protein